jgi:hypothetical protein
MRNPLRRPWYSPPWTRRFRSCPATNDPGIQRNLSPAGACGVESHPSQLMVPVQDPKQLQVSCWLAHHPTHWEK